MPVPTATVTQALGSCRQTLTSQAQAQGQQCPPALTRTAGSMAQPVPGLWQGLHVR